MKNIIYLNGNAVYPKISGNKVIAMMKVVGVVVLSLQFLKDGMNLKSSTKNG